MLRQPLALLLVLLLPAAPPALADDENQDRPPADLRASVLYGEGPGLEGGVAQVEDGRNVGVAFLLSGAVPGAGQAYNRQWVKAAVALGIEAALVTGYLTWRQRGLDAEDDYIDYAHAHWSPARYATWLNGYAAYLESERGMNIRASEIVIPDGIDFQNPGGWSAEDRRAVRTLIDQIQAVELEAVSLETGATFSHRLPAFGDQQYYELIGKYFQFAPGWDDYAGALDPSETGPDGSKPNVSARFYDYADDHAEANDLLRRASRVTSFVVVNHFLAAFEAALSARLHNNRLSTRMEVGYGPGGTPQPQATLRVRL